MRRETWRVVDEITSRIPIGEVESICLSTVDISVSNNKIIRLFNYLSKLNSPGIRYFGRLRTGNDFEGIIDNHFIFPFRTYDAQIAREIVNEASRYFAARNVNTSVV